MTELATLPNHLRHPLISNIKRYAWEYRYVGTGPMRGLIVANPALQVDADALRRLSDVLARHADTAASIDPTAPALTAAHALIATRLAAACERAGAGLRQAYRTLADRTRDMSVAALVNADDYDATDAAFGRLLKAYEAGMG